MEVKEKIFKFLRLLKAQQGLQSSHSPSLRSEGRWDSRNKRTHLHGISGAALWGWEDEALVRVFKKNEKKFLSQPTWS